MATKFKPIDIDDLTQMSLPELKKNARKIFNTANKRVTRLEKFQKEYLETTGAEVSSPGITQFKESGGRFAITNKSRKSKTRNQLIKEIIRAQNFMENKTVTKSGIKKFYKEMKQNFKEAGLDLKDWSNEDINKFLGLFEQLRKNFPEINKSQFKYGIMEDIKTNLDKNVPPNEIINKMTSELVEKIGEQHYEKNAPIDNGDFFRKLV